MFTVRERALIYVMTASIAATGATAYTAVSGESAEQRQVVTYKAAQSLSNSEDYDLIEESGFYDEPEGIYVSRLTKDEDDIDDGLFVDGKVDARLSAEEVSAILDDFERVYPTGTLWTNDNYYRCKGDGYAAGGFGCAAFAYMISDSIYGKAGYHKSYDLNGIQPYDVVELYNGRHTAFVISVNDNDTVTVAEANVNDMVRWGAEYSIDDISSVLMRY